MSFFYNNFWKLAVKKTGTYQLNRNKLEHNHPLSLYKLFMLFSNLSKNVERPNIWRQLNVWTELFNLHINDSSPSVSIQSLTNKQPHTWTVSTMSSIHWTFSDWLGAETISALLPSQTLKQKSAPIRGSESTTWQKRLALSEQEPGAFWSLLLQCSEIKVANEIVPFCVRFCVHFQFRYSPQYFYPFPFFEVLERICILRLNGFVHYDLARICTS